MRKIAKRDFQRGEVKDNEPVPEALLLEDRSGVCAVVFPVSEELFNNFRDNFKRLEMAIQFATLSQQATKNAPPLSLEEIQEEIDAYRRSKKGDKA